MSSPFDFQQGQIGQFQALTNAEESRARFFLEASDWNLDAAVSAFFENGEEAEVEEVPVDRPAEAPEPMEEASGRESGEQSRSGGGERSKKAPSDRVATLASLGRHDDSSDEDNEESDEESGQTFYAGGSETSGQQILGPPKKKKGASEFVSDMFRRARAAGAEAVESGYGPGSSSGSSAAAFSGTAFRLGSEVSDSEMVPSSQPPKPAPPREFTLKMWSNGFSIDDGPLRAYNDPQNREFLTSVMGGRIPKELVREARGGEVHVNMEDHKEEEYVKPKAVNKPFTGEGHMLGSIAPTVVGAGEGAGPAQASTPEQNSANEQLAKERVKVDQDAATTNLQVRLPDGSRLLVNLNHSHTVGQLREYVSLARPQFALAPFSLRTTFPNKTLDDDGATIKDAGILNAAILLRPQ